MIINIPKQDLINYYNIMGLSTPQIGEIYSCSHTTILRRMIEYNIPRRTISETKQGKNNPMYGKIRPEHGKLMKKLHKNNKNGNWKGDNVKYSGLHAWIRNHKQKSEYCIICNDYNKKLECCSIDHIYTRNPEDWIWLCKECHTLFDKCRKELRKNNGNNNN